MAQKEIVPKSPFTEWVLWNGGFEYYISRFDRLLKDISIKIFADRAYGFYDGYMILEFALYDRQLFLILDKEYLKFAKDDVVQKKLFHEYKYFFLLEQNPFKITQANIFEVEKYINIVIPKVNAGFKRYETLLEEQKLTNSNTTFLRIEIDNAFSLSELNELISCYNKLYSLIACVSEIGLEEALKKDRDFLFSSHNMILESIHIGSRGDFITAGIEYIVSLLKEMVNLALESDKREYEKKKAAVELKISEENLQFQRRKDIFELLKMLDYYFERKNDPSKDPRMHNILDNEIAYIMQQIEFLQGTRHIDLIA